MERAVYSPKAFVYVRTDLPDGTKTIIDLTEYVVSGSVARRVNQVSEAEIEIRNPGKKFTTPGSPTFRPMDPITIWLQRMPKTSGGLGGPVQVFTGFLDSTPYYQLHPGTCTLKASCTLKKLLYTYWDQGLPATFKLLHKYGWDTNLQSGQIYNQTAQTQEVNGEHPTVGDSSIGKLLVGILKDVAKWPEKQIYVEGLPTDLAARILNIQKDIEENSQVDAAKQAYQKFLEKFLLPATSGTADQPADVGNYNGPLNKTFPKHFLDSPGNWARLSPAQVRGLADKAGLPGVMFERIAHGEAQYYPGVVQHDPGDGNVGYGLWQITPHAWGSGSAAATYLDSLGGIEEMLNPWKCALMAKFLYDHAGSKTPGVKGFPWYGTQYLAGYTSADENAPKTEDTTQVESHQQAAVGTHPSEGATGDQIKKASRKGGNVADQSTSEVKHDGKKGTRFDAIVAEANRLNKLGAPYNNARPPNDTNGYDCSSSCADLMKAAGYTVPYFSTATAPQYMKAGPDPTGRLTFWNDDAAGTGGNSVHIFATINGRDWGTGANARGGPGWHDHTKTGFQPYHIEGLDEPATLPTNADTSTGTASSGAGGPDSPQFATAFATTFEFTSQDQIAEANLLTGEKSLMNDQTIFPFIEQLAQGSLRNFQSMPDGSFLAFFPDYFGTFDHRKPYWAIENIEILDGKIELSDDALTTHMYVVGNTIAPLGNAPNLQVANEIASTGVATIFNMDALGFISGGLFNNKNDALAFLRRYGARPYLEDATYIRNHFFETFLAIHMFMQAWARQFLSTFTFTFQPELYPGGRVLFPDHDLVMYIDEVNHSFSYESGFTTQANLSAPSSWRGTLPVSRGMIQSSSF